MKLSRRSSLIWLCLSLPVASVSHGATFLTQFIFDDYQDPFDTTQLSTVPISPGLVQAYIGPTVDTTQNPAIVVDYLTTTDTAGTRRTTTLTIDPIIHIGDLTAFVSIKPASGVGPNISIGADPATAGTLNVNYDFQTTPLGWVDAGTGNDHVIIHLLDGESNGSNAFLEFRDLDGTVIRKNMSTDLGLNLAEPNTIEIPFTEFPDIDFTKLAGMELTWEAGIAYDGAIALIGTGTFNPPAAAVPEPSLAVALGALGLSFLRRRRNL